MKKKPPNTERYDFLVISGGLIAIWQLISSLALIPSFMLPSPWQIIKVFLTDFQLLFYHGAFSLSEALMGLGLATLLGFIIAVMMDQSHLCRRLMHPLMIISQSIPSIALAPLLVLWFGYDLAPKVVLIILICFFPVASSLFSAFQNCDHNLLKLFKSMGANRWQTMRHLKIPLALPDFFSGLKIAGAYALVGAVVAEWMGGNNGLGVYMTRAKKSFAFDKVFAAILIVTIFSQLLVKLLIVLERRAIPWHGGSESRWPK